MKKSDIPFSEKVDLIAGVDEVGRGPLAGDVVAAAVILDPKNPIAGLMDSKKLSHKKRVLLAAEINEKAQSVAIGRASVTEIDEFNILKATMLAMSRAVDGLLVTPKYCLIDGNRVPPNLPCPADAIVKGDSKVEAISAASIVAKVQRDGEMVELDEQHPQYGFKRHKGYGTKEHLAAIADYGVIDQHRRSFAPVRNRLTTDS